MIGDDSLRNKDEWISRESHEAELTILRNQVAQWRQLYETAQRMVEMQNNQAARELALSHAAGQEAVVSARDVFRIAGGDTECCPNPSAKAAMDCLIDLRACYDEGSTTNPAEIGRKSVGGEAVVPTCEECGATFLELHECKEPAWEKVGVLDGYGRITGEPKVRIIDRRLEPGTLLYKLTHAQPPASAEVEFMAKVYLALGSLQVPKMTPARAEYWKAGARAAIHAVNAAMAASSGRKGDAT